jgi:hypothetical protein
MDTQIRRLNMADTGNGDPPPKPPTNPKPPGDDNPA